MSSPRHPPGSRPRRRPTRVVLTVMALLVGLLVLVTPPGPARAATDPCGPGGNAVACENSKPGTDPAVWDVNGAGDAGIQGFSTDISVDVGDRLDLKIDTDARAYTVTIFRLGYYQGLGARRIATVTPSAALPQQQPPCITDAATELYDCGNWAVSASWDVPSTAVSGVYIALLRDPVTGDASHVTFVVRDDASTSDVVLQTSDPTWQAYNRYGGSDFYQGGAHGRAYKVSYNRPVMTRGETGGRDFFMANEYPLVRFLERNGYDVSYLAGIDSDRHGALLKNHRTFLSVGHDEYWSKAQRANVEAARDAGVNLQFLSGNEAYWKTRYEASADPGHTPYRTLVSYKETWANAKIDPSEEWTGTWRDPRFAPPSRGGGVPENGLTGTMYMSNDTDLSVQVSAAEAKLRLWRGTSLATSTAASTSLAPHTVGYESDEDVDNGSRPPGLVRLSTTTGPAPQYLRDFGNITSAGTTTHHLTLYRAASGALVFSAGTIQWTWGLDAEHDSPYAAVPADVRMQQAQVNLLADMGAQPTTLAAGLVAATRSTDTTGPTTVVTTPAAGTTVANGTLVTTTGTASDVAGRVAGVEVSTDDGSTWHPATGTTSWSYTYVQHGAGAANLKVRAVDDSANIGPVSTRSSTVSCPCTVYGVEAPVVPAASDGSAVELGLRFTPTVAGFVSGVRFYKGAGNTGTHAGSLWTAAGTRLATVSFTGETATGWQTASFANPVPVTVGQTYVVSYTAPAGHYAALNQAFAASGVAAPPLRVDGGFDAAPAGVYAAPGAFPTSSHQRTAYYVDPVVVLTDTSPLAATAPVPTPGAGAVATTTTVRTTFSRPVVASSVAVSLTTGAGTAVPGTTTYDAASRTVTFTPTSPLAAPVLHSVVVSATDAQGVALTTGRTWSFTTTPPGNPPGVCPCSLFDDATVPTQPEDTDTAAVTLGVRFSSEVAGVVTGVKFFKGLRNTGTHVGTLWGPDGTKLAEGTFVGESDSGWQRLTFATPVPIRKDVTYTAAYRAGAGRYAASPGAFAASDLSRPPLHVGATAGAYTYGTGAPTSTSAASYLVDVVMDRSTPTVTTTSQTPAPGAVEVGRGTPVTVGFSAPLSAGAVLALTTGGQAVPGTTTLDATGTRLTLVPAGALDASTTYQVRLSGVTSTDGATMPTTTWTFTTRATGGTTQSLFADVVPATAAADDSSAVELGTAFVPARNGSVTSLRFYKGPGNGGTHVGTLWAVDGTRLATATFTGETSAGWQVATLPSPVAVNAGSTYVVSYLAPQGHYAVTPGMLLTPWVSGDLTAPSVTNGRYRYGAAGGFPTSTYGAASYFADVGFVAGP